VRFGSRQRPPATHAAPDGSERHHFLQRHQLRFEKSIGELLFVHFFPVKIFFRSKIRRTEKQTAKTKAANCSISPGPLDLKNVWDKNPCRPSNARSTGKPGGRR